MQKYNKEALNAAGRYASLSLSISYSVFLESSIL